MFASNIPVGSIVRNAEGTYRYKGKGNYLKISNDTAVPKNEVEPLSEPKVFGNKSKTKSKTNNSDEVEPMENPSLDFGNEEESEEKLDDHLENPPLHSPVMDFSNDN